MGKVLALHRAFEAAGVIHAFGGALALAYWTADPRATVDIDVNVSLPASAARRALEALPAGVGVPDDGLAQITANDQIRLRWGRTPVDLFFRVIDFHDGVAARSVLRPFAAQLLPFVCADDLAVLKSLFDRPKDWLDIAAMVQAGSLHIPTVIGRVADIVGSGDERIARLGSLTTT